MNAPDETVDVIVAGSAGASRAPTPLRARDFRWRWSRRPTQFGGTFAYSGGGGMWYPVQSGARARGRATTPSNERPQYYRNVVGDRTPRRTPGDLRARRRRADRIPRAATSISRSRSCRGRTTTARWPGARNDGMRHIVSRAVPDNRLGRFQGLVRGPLDHERLGAPQPDLLTGGRAVIGRFLAAMADNPAVAAHLNTRLVELVVDDGRVAGGGGGARRRGG